MKGGFISSSRRSRRSGRRRRQVLSWLLFSSGTVVVHVHTQSKSIKMIKMTFLTTVWWLMQSPRILNELKNEPELCQNIWSFAEKIFASKYQTPPQWSKTCGEFIWHEDTEKHNIVNWLEGMCKSNFLPNNLPPTLFNWLLSKMWTQSYFNKKSCYAVVVPQIKM